VKIGATGDFPDGKINPSDEGGLMIAVTKEEGRVVIHFGKPTAWIGFDTEGAVAFALMVLKNAGASHVEVTMGEKRSGGAS
jgi:hypothetical protein